MGDRALVVFVSSYEDKKGKSHFVVSPTAYLHWDGNHVESYLLEHKELMKTRLGDESYALARFIGIAHSKDPDNNLSLGCFETPKDVQTAIARVLTGNTTPMKTKVSDYSSGKHKTTCAMLSPKEVICNYSHGDAGVVVVNTRDYSWKAYGGYLQLDDDLEVKDCA